LSDKSGVVSQVWCGTGALAGRSNVLYYHQAISPAAGFLIHRSYFVTYENRIA
jgi:hypothetical protein